MKTTELSDRQLACDNSAQAESDTALPVQQICCAQTGQRCCYSLLLTQGALTGQKGSEHLCYHVSLCQQLAAAHTHLLPQRETSEEGKRCLLKQQPCRSWKAAATSSTQPTHCNERNAMQTNTRCKHLNVFPYKK